MADPERSTPAPAGAAPTRPDNITPPLHLQETQGFTAPDIPGETPAAFQTIAGYEILEELGRGGMGIVYKARQKGLGRLVALKMILHADHAGEDERRRFLHEAEALARLRHENIIQIHEVGEHDGKPFFSLEYIEGGSLDRLLRGTPLPPRDAARLVQQLAGGMQAAHDAGIIHRDLKPANILLAGAREEGQGTRPEKPEQPSSRVPPPSSLAPKITDFGLARNVNESGQTQSGAILGTPSYMAPEQAGGKVHSLDVRTDVYALGAILYECLTGRPPFRAATALDTMMQVLQDEPVPPRQLNPVVPRDLETVCLKCLQKDPGKRFATPAQLGEDLRRFLDGEPILARPVGRVTRLVKWVKRKPTAAALWAVILTTLAGGAVAWAQFTSSLQEERDYAFEKEGEAKRQEGKAIKQAEETERQKGIVEKNSELRKAHEDLQNETAAKQKADDARADALQKQVKESHTALYAKEMRKAQLAWQSGDLLRSLELLDATPADARDWEWNHLRGLCRRKAEPLAGHTSMVTCVAYSPDGSRLASGGYDNTVRLWDPAAGRELFTLRGHGSPLLALTFSADGRRLFSADTRGVMRVWDVEAGKESHKGNFGGPVQCVAFHPQGPVFAWGAAGFDASVYLWEPQKEQQPRLLKGHTIGLLNVAFSPDGKQLASLDRKGIAKVWNTGSSQEEYSFHSGASTLSGHFLCFSPDGRLLAAPASTARIRLWDARLGRPLLTLAGHPERRQVSVAFHPDCQVLASCAHDGVVKLWELRNGQELAVLHGHALMQDPFSGVAALAWRPDGRRLATAGGDHLVKVWQPDLGQDAVTMHPVDQVLHGAEFAPDAGRLAILASGWSNELAGRATLLTLVDLASGRDTAVLPVDASAGTVHFSPDRQRLVLQTAQRDLSIRDARTGRETASVQVLYYYPTSLAFSPDGKLLAGNDDEATVTVWDSHTGQTVHSFRGLKEGSAHGLAFSPDGRLLAAGMQGALRLWEVATGKALHTLTRRGGPGALNVLVFSPDGKLLATAGAGPGVTVWDTATGKESQNLKGHERGLLTLAFSPDGRRMVSAGRDRLVKVWDVESWKEAQSLAVPGEPVARLEYSADGKRLAGLCFDGVVKIWDAESWKELHTLTGLTGPAARVSFSADGRRLAGFGNVVRVWDVETGKQVFARDAQRDHWREAAFWPDRDHLTIRQEVSVREKNAELRSDVVRVMNLATGQQAFSFNTSPMTGERVAAYHPNGRDLCIHRGDGMTQLRDARTGQGTRTLKGPGLQVLNDGQTLFSPDGHYLASAGSDAERRQVLKLWDTRTGEQLPALPESVLTSCKGIAFTPDSRCVAAIHQDPNGDMLVRVWEVASQGPTRRLRPGNGKVRAVLRALAFSPDGRFLVAAGGEDVRVNIPGNAYVWEMASGDQFQVLKGHTSAITCLAFSPDGRRLASGGDDRTIRLWDAATWQELLTLRGHTTGVRHLVFHAGGKRLLSFDVEGTVRLWDAKPSAEK